jgi:hypothetical protein
MTLQLLPILNFLIYEENLFSFLSVYRQSARPPLQSSELGLPHSLSHRRVRPPLLVLRGGTHSLAGEGVGGVPMPTRTQRYSRY